MAELWRFGVVDIDGNLPNLSLNLVDVICVSELVHSKAGVNHVITLKIYDFKNLYFKYLHTSCQI